MCFTTTKADFLNFCFCVSKQVMDDNPLGELCKGVADISKCNILNREFSGLPGARDA